MTVESTNQDTQAAQAANTASSPTQTGAANPGSTEAKFTQADIDRILNEKLEKAPQKEARIKAELLKQLGLTEDADFDTLKSTITKARDIELANLSAVEKAEKLLADEKKRADDAQAQLAAERAERRNDKIATYLQSQASAMKAADPETVLMWAQQKHKAALDEIMGEDGTLNEGKAKALLEKIKAEKAVFFQRFLGGAGSPSNSNGHVLSNEAEALKRASRNNQATIRGR